MTFVAMSRHDRNLAAAFDQQAAQFEQAPVQTDAAALERLVAFADAPPEARILDCGCGPGLVAEAFLEAGHHVHGIDLSREMVRRARARCARFGERARFECRSAFDPGGDAGYDVALSRYVLHHLQDPAAFIRRQAELVRPGGAVVASDHTTDPDPARASWHQEIERFRDGTHVRNLTPGELVDLFVGVGLVDVTLAEEPFELDFDEWFDRGTPTEEKSAVHTRILEGSAMGFWPTERKDGEIKLACRRVAVRGRRSDTPIRPATASA